jgi:uncharacterized protein YdeI (YjbR/CyaY-like superfamily)
MKELPELHLRNREEWAGWLDGNHAGSPGVWLKLAKKGADGLSRADALEVALCYGWIDGQAASVDDASWLQRFTPRTRRSRWSRINRDAVEALIAAGHMKPKGLAEVEAAKRDGRWEAAYDSPRTIAVPDDLRAKLEEQPRGWELFQALDSRNRFAILYRIQEARRADTRARRIDKYVRMVLDGETIH